MKMTNTATREECLEIDEWPWHDRYGAATHEHHH
jgi:hypothetical protein